ncbi:Mitochondrial ornithine transporter 1 [Sarcoptes scabiei]|uniref:Mitochondrial ornithine transporter 1 n=1 Tax=Sarcoptes scabiei TaxID=52283 RepID=A0A834VAH1_SARSC|nr:Mitochondrial ornithine transporter 1 [Sarcoptes scabiei]
MSPINSTESKEKNLNPILFGTIDFVAGCNGGIANVLVGQPLDTIKVKMQTFPNLYKNPWICFKQTFSKEGIRRGLYAGTSPALLANVAENSVLFCAYGFCQNLIKNFRNKNSLNTLENATAGFMAAFFSSFTLCPTELIKCKLQALRETGHHSSNITSYQLTRSILKQEGIAGLFRGLTSTMFREMPGYFFFFGGCEYTKSMFRSSKNQDLHQELGLVQSILAGGIGGVCLWISIFRLML